MKAKIRKTPEEKLANLRIKRAQKYPPLADFADALYWERRGDPKPMEAYLSAVDKVKSEHPK